MTRVLKPSPDCSSTSQVKKMHIETLQTYLDREVGDARLRDLLDRIASACWSISSLVGRSALQGNQGEAGTLNSQGEVQKPLDLMADEVFAHSCSGNGSVAALISEEREGIVSLKDAQPGDFVVSYDPLDGSSNLDVDLSVGTIFAVSTVSEGFKSDHLPSGRELLCSGYAIYGPSTMLVLTVGGRVDGFTLETATDTFVLTHPHMTVAPETSEFAINASRFRHWDESIQDYVSQCIDGRNGSRGKAFNMRWTASFVAEVHRILIRGGVFLYPTDDENRFRGGKLRLLYEANPMAMIIEAAGGRATDGQTDLLDIVAHDLHQRTSVVLGSRTEVERIAAAYIRAERASRDTQFTLAIDG